jgi:polar amino acid transport system permease protein
MIYPAQIFVFVGIVYLVLCTALQWVTQRVLLRVPPARGNHAGW